MAEPFIGEIRMAGFNFAPRGWAMCDGQLLPISQNSAMFSLLGTMFGGDGRTTFGLPELRGRSPIHQGSGPGLTTRRMGQKGGQETVTLTTPEIPSHNHSVTMMAESKNANQTNPAGNILAPGSAIYRANSNADDVPMASGAIRQSNVGGNLAHQNMAPFQVVNFVIALVGLFPSRS